MQLGRAPRESDVDWLIQGQRQSLFVKESNLGVFKHARIEFGTDRKRRDQCHGEILGAQLRCSDCEQSGTLACQIRT